MQTDHKAVQPGLTAVRKRLKAMEPALTAVSKSITAMKPGVTAVMTVPARMIV